MKTREELVNAVGDAWGVWRAGDYDLDAWKSAYDALIAYDKES